jgi:hypothetical protein
LIGEPGTFPEFEDDIPERLNCPQPADLESTPVTRSTNGSFSSQIDPAGGE